MSHAQLQAARGELFDASPERWFGELLPAFLSEHAAAARAIGGTIGFIVDDRQWLVNLDFATVEGDAKTDIVDERDGIDAVLDVSARDLAHVLRGSHATAASLRIVKGSLASLEPFVRLLEAGV